MPKPQTKKLLTVSDDELKESFFNLKDSKQVANLLQVSYNKLNYYTVATTSNNYTVFTIKKKAGGERVICAPHTPLKIIQRKLNEVLSAVYVAKYSVHGFVRKRSIRSNAAPHVRKNLVLNLDLENFFNGINFGRVRGMFMKPPYDLPPSVATVLAQICCYNNQLPQGAPTSPIVSNMICRGLDYQLANFARKRNCTYTRYADDITFSTNRENLSQSIARIEHDADGKRVISIADELNTIIHEKGFSINRNKVRLRTRSQRQEVTGLIVNEKVNVSRTYINKIRAMLHAWSRFQLDKAAEAYFSLPTTKHRAKGTPATTAQKSLLFRRIVRSKIEFLRTVRDSNFRPYRILLEKYKSLNPGTKVTIRDELHPLLEKVKDWIWLIDDCNDGPNGEVLVDEGTAFMLDNVGLITCNHCVTGGVTTVKNAVKYTVELKVKKIFYPDLAEQDLAVLRFADEEAACKALSKEPGNLYQGLKALPHADYDIGKEVYVCGFINYHVGDLPALPKGYIIGRGMRSLVRRVLVDTWIESGMSGGPMLDEIGNILGVAVSGVQTRPGTISDALKDVAEPLKSPEAQVASTYGRFAGLAILFSASQQQRIKEGLVKEISTKVSELLRLEIQSNIKQLIKTYRLSASKVEMTAERGVIPIDYLLGGLKAKPAT